MKSLFVLLSLTLATLLGTVDLYATPGQDSNTQEQVDSTQLVDTPTAGTAEHAVHEEDTDHTDTHDASHAESAHAGEDDHSPAPWSVAPFIILLLMIATGPLFYPHFWHKNYPIVAAVLGAITVVYYLAFLGDTHHPIHAFFEYFSFIALIAALFVASGGILIKVDREGTPMANVVLLIIGAALANVIGTTGASMLLIRPFVRLNQHRVKPYHIVFFIFMVSNVGGVLTPIGDPPLFLGFLKGVPFFWTAAHLWPKWLFGIALLSMIFYFVDRKNHANYGNKAPKEYSGKIQIKGVRNALFLLVTIIAVFLDPNVLDWLPGILNNEAAHTWSIGSMASLSPDVAEHTAAFSFIREIIMLTAAVLAFKTADKECLKGNEFDFEPIKEVGFLFIGIFATMMPALQLISGFANSESGQNLVNTDTLYWFTGMLSGVLDNAPTYLNFLAAGMGKLGLDIGSQADVLQYTTDAVAELMAISVGAVFFGAFTYIGNAPNFMVKSIAEQIGIQMPSFVGYIVRYSVPILMPVLLLTWLVFFFL